MGYIIITILIIRDAQTRHGTFYFFNIVPRPNESMKINFLRRSAKGNIASRHCGNGESLATESAVDNVKAAKK
jgi:hypothetical protein